MSGFAFLTASCFACGKLVTCNPTCVPSYDNTPLCESCVERINVKRKELGLREWEIPEGAYRACPEEELDGDGMFRRPARLREEAS